MKKFQSAYKKYHSTETALIRVQSDILQAMDNHRGVVLVLLDLSAAFDTIDHDILFCQLSARLGIRGIALNWFDSYLRNRTQSITVNGTSSPANTLKYGVPQGLVLSPLLFTIYTLRLGDILSKSCIPYHLFADDTQLYHTFDAKDPEDLDLTIRKLQNCVEEIKDWMHQNKLKLNEEKTEVLIITSSQLASNVNISSFKVESAEICPSSSVRNINVQFDSTMSMKEHVLKVCKVAYFHLRNIGALYGTLFCDACAKLVHSLVTSRINYGNALLMGVPDRLLKRLQRILHVAARIVSPY